MRIFIIILSISLLVGCEFGSNDHYKASQELKRQQQDQAAKSSDVRMPTRECVEKFDAVISGRASIDQIKGLLHCNHMEGLSSVIPAITKYKEHRSDSIELLEEMWLRPEGLQSEDFSQFNEPYVRVAVAYSLYRMTNDVKYHDYLIENLNSDNSMVVARTLELLGMLKLDEDLKHIRPYLNSESERIRASARIALSNYKQE